MFKIRSNTIQEAFRTKIQIIQHNYATSHSKNNFGEPKILNAAKVCNFLT